MIIIGGLAFILVLVVLLVLLLTFRRWTLDEARTEARLRSPGSHGVVYVIPDGQDPTALMAALTNAGFVSVVDTRAGVERLLVECEEKDRVRVRGTIEQVERSALGGGHALPARTVSFEDEPKDASGPLPA
jgi:hypothetical protein